MLQSAEFWNFLNTFWLYIRYLLGLSGKIIIVEVANMYMHVDKILNEILRIKWIKTICLKKLFLILLPSLIGLVFCSGVKCRISFGQPKVQNPRSVTKLLYNLMFTKFEKFYLFPVSTKGKSFLYTHSSW